VRLIRLVGCAALLLLLLPAFGGSRTASALPGVESIRAQDLTAPVRVGSKTTYFDVLRKLFPDLDDEGNAHGTVPFGSLSEPGERQAITGDIKFEFKPYWIDSEGRRLLLLRVDLTAEGTNVGTPYEGEAVVLAAFALEPEPRLLDALDVKTDRFTGFWEDRPTLRLSPRDDALVVYSTHSNAGESYVGIDVLFVDGGRFRKITSFFMYNTQGCGVGYTQAPSFSAAADPGRKYPRVVVKVKLRREPDGPECERRAAGYTRFYQGVYRWDASKRRYEGGSRQLDRLGEFNAKRVSSP
jgi:hypothetical protein